MVEGGREKRPYKDLLIADEHGGSLIMNTYCSRSKEVQRNAVFTERLPHCDWNGNAFLIEHGVFLPAREEHIQVLLLRKRISRPSGWVDTGSDKHGTVLRCQHA